MPESSAPTPLGRSAGPLLVLVVFVLAICGLVYELIAGTLSSYLLGDSVTQFSLVIGIFLTAMGIGSFISKFITKNLIAWLVGVEISVGLVGGLSSLIGFAAFSLTSIYQPVLVLMVLTIGILVGLEIPLVVRILKELQSLRVTLANVLSADYLGALVASVLFPFALLPHLGLIQGAAVVGLVNVTVAGLFLWKFATIVGPAAKRLKLFAILDGVALIVVICSSNMLTTHMENLVYQDEIILARNTPHSRMIITHWRGDVRLYLNGHLQFSTVDEYRYHESLVHPAMSASERQERVLILGGGDGLAARLVARYQQVKKIDVVDIDAEVTRLFTEHAMLAKLNDHVFRDPRVTVHNRDAFHFVREAEGSYDVILMDLPDPSAPELGKLYSRAIFGLLGRRLAPGGVLAAQSTSPFRSRQAFWCIVNTMESARWGPDNQHRLYTHPYHTLVPTFGTWGFVLAAKNPIDVNSLDVPENAKYLTRELLPTLFVFPPDMDRVETPISTLDNPVIFSLYRSGYHKFFD